MNTTLHALLAIAVSILPLCLLAWRDPKRLGDLHRRGDALGVPARRGLGIVALLPGIVLGVIGQWPAFLIWLGAVAAQGWLLALALSPKPSASTRATR
jgi:hypothetical protein